MRTFASIASYAAAMDRAARDLNDEARSKITRAQGERAQKIADRAAMNDLGSDRAFSGWRRADRITLDTKLIDAKRGATILAPTRVSAGPWTVAEDGRNRGTSAFLGPGVNRRTGLTMRNKSGEVRVGRGRRRRRWNGHTQGKNTASDARKLMERDLPRFADKQFGVVLRKHFDVD